MASKGEEFVLIHDTSYSSERSSDREQSNVVAAKTLPVAEERTKEVEPVSSTAQATRIADNVPKDMDRWGPAVAERATGGLTMPSDSVRAAPWLHEQDQRGRQPSTAERSSLPLRLQPGDSSGNHGNATTDIVTLPSDQGNDPSGYLATPQKLFSDAQEALVRSKGAVPVTNHPPQQEQPSEFSELNLQSVRRGHRHIIPNASMPAPAQPAPTSEAAASPQSIHSSHDQYHDAPTTSSAEQEMLALQSAQPRDVVPQASVPTTVQEESPPKRRLPAHASMEMLAFQRAQRGVVEQSKTVEGSALRAMDGNIDSRVNSAVPTPRNSVGRRSEEERKGGLFSKVRNSLRKGT